MERTNRTRDRECEWTVCQSPKQANASHLGTKSLISCSNTDRNSPRKKHRCNIADNFYSDGACSTAMVRDFRRQSAAARHVQGTPTPLSCGGRSTSVRRRGMRRSLWLLAIRVSRLRGGRFWRSGAGRVIFQRSSFVCEGEFDESMVHRGNLAAGRYPDDAGSGQRGRGTLPSRSLQAFALPDVVLHHFVCADRLRDLVWHGV